MPLAVHSISKLLVLPIVIVAAFILYLGSYVNQKYTILIFVPAILLVVLYVMQAPLDHWWKKKYPISFDPKLKEWLVKYFIYYNELSDADKETFEYRLSLYLDARLFQSVGQEMKNVPIDIQCMVASHGTLVSLYKEDYLLGEMDRIFLYKHPFPTPKLHALHNVEVDTEDGVIILSLEQAVNALLQPTVYYSVAFHAYIEAFLFVNTLHVDIEEDWDLILRISGFTKADILTQTGHPEANFHIVIFTLFFTHKELMYEHSPINFAKLEKLWTL